MISALVDLGKALAGVVGDLRRLRRDRRDRVSEYLANISDLLNEIASRLEKEKARRTTLAPAPSVATRPTGSSSLSRGLRKRSPSEVCRFNGVGAPSVLLYICGKWTFLPAAGPSASSSASSRARPEASFGPAVWVGMPPRRPLRADGGRLLRSS